MEENSPFKKKTRIPFWGIFRGVILKVVNQSRSRFTYDGAFGEPDSEGSGEEPSGVGATVPEGAQFCGASGLRGFTPQLVPAPVDANGNAWYVLAFWKLTWS